MYCTDLSLVGTNNTNYYVLHWSQFDRHEQYWLLCTVLTSIWSARTILVTMYCTGLSLIGTNNTSDYVLFWPEFDWHGQYWLLCTALTSVWSARTILVTVYCTGLHLIGTNNTSDYVLHWPQWSARTILVTPCYLMVTMTTVQVYLILLPGVMSLIYVLTCQMKKTFPLN